MYILSEIKVCSKIKKKDPQEHAKKHKIENIVGFIEPAPRQ